MCGWVFGWGRHFCPVIGIDGGRGGEGVQFVWGWGLGEGAVWFGMGMEGRESSLAGDWEGGEGGPICPVMGMDGGESSLSCDCNE